MDEYVILDTIKELFSISWNFLANTFVPGTNFSFGVILFTFALIGVSLKFIGFLLGVNVNMFQDTHYNSSKSTKGKISEDRKGDTH